MINQIILASSSPARKRLLARLQLPFITISPDIDETALPHETPETLVQRLALQKAQKVASTHTNALIIASDQVTVINEEIVSKPLSHENAVKQLEGVSGRDCLFFNGLCLFNSQTQAYQIAVETFTVTYRTLSRTMIEHYLQKEQPYACAGSIKSEGLAIALFERMTGNDPTALEGLPLIRLTSMLRHEGIDPVLMPST
jgi:septum formation protein